LEDAQKNLIIPKSSSKFVSEIRVGRPKPNILRLVFNLSQPVKFKAFTYSVNHLKQQKIIIDVSAANKKVQNLIETTKIPPKKYLIVIDPGHGGKDVGAVGRKGGYEKNVVLAISKKLAALINKQPNFKAVLTRDKDYYVTLRGRLQVARFNKADIFVAIHADSYFNDLASGASVYALSQRGATSEAARWLAQRENYSELDNVDLNELSNQNRFLRYVMIDLAQTATISDSIRLGHSLIGSLQEVVRLRYPRVEQAPFMVLKSPDIPSVLVEVGFISNPKEEMLLRDPIYQTKLAKALLNGLLKFSAHI
jgi:N-acetylmuramoyl-L-alanine amidase